MKDAQENAYLFRVYPLGVPFKDIGGCYALTRQDSDGWFIAYIGQTDSLAGRFDNIDKMSYVKEHGITHIAVRVNGSEMGRQMEEEALINFYKPPCNARQNQAAAA
jgi:hypothetical protein